MTTENLTYAAAHDLAALIHRFGRETLEAAWQLVQDEPIGSLAELMRGSAEDPNEDDDDE